VRPDTTDGKTTKGPARSTEGRTKSSHRRRGQRNKCRFCKSGREADYKDVRTLLKLSTPQGKIYSRKRSGNCAYHQRKVKGAIKRARFLALLPYTGRS